MDLIKKTNIDFVTNRNFFLRLSILASVIGMLVVLAPEIPGLGIPRLIEPGIDFTGGTQTTVSFANTATSAEQVRGALAKAGYSSAEIKSFGKDGDFLIRINDVQDEASKVSADLVTKLNTAFSKNGEKAVILLGADNVGAKVSAELAADAAISLIIATIIILLYVAFRFEFVYGLSAVIALAHDVTVAFVISVLVNKLGILNLELSINSLAAYLTILGYSINDKVVVFDRIRENRERHRGMPLAELVNLSLNETLSRTLITGVSVLGALLVMVFLGGDVLEGFAFTMFVGIVVGTYSSIYVASSFLIWYTERVKHKSVGSVVHTEA
ncbi:MAG: protein translocase subunit SecF [Candidatus Kapabacteria bacterium]|nr:protein translocase subunit SecF [Candidatus Kapabacteria bacterium]